MIGSLRRRFAFTLTEVLVLLALAFVLISLISPYVSAHLGTRDGGAAASADIADGVLRFRIGGYRRPEHLEAIAGGRYGIEIVTSGCLPSEYVRAFDESYNDEMQAEIDQRFPGVSLEMMRAEAEESAKTEDDK